MNSFIDYLNSLNNASGSNENALAESQILSEYYSSIVVDRKIASHIFDLLFKGENNTAIVLTGHAGDGKTSILIQILKELGCFRDGVRPLQEYDTYKDEFLYVKDMSELNEKIQEEVFVKFLTASKNRMSSLLISNTGPLINTAKRLINNTNTYSSNLEQKNECEDFEINLLSNIDKVESGNVPIKVNNEEYVFKVINLANIDNTYFVGEIMAKLMQEKLWDKCSDCIAKKRCPACSNYEIISNNQARIVSFISRLYFWLADRNQRLTIRQILSHLSYAITGNLNCNEINKIIIENEDGLFQYNFANLFFGYHGTKLDKESLNIKAIRELNDIKLEDIALREDYLLFVKEDYSVFDDGTKDILNKTLNLNYQKLGLGNEETILMRRAFRRFYILLSRLDEDSYNEMLEQIFDNVFPEYYLLSTEENSSVKVKNKVKEIVFNGLFKHFIGVYPNNSNELYLTLKKDDNEFQNVQLVLGEMRKTDLKIDTSRIHGNIEPCLRINKVVIKLKKYFELSYQTLNYLDNISRGKIYTKLNPSFTFDLTKLKSVLISEYGRVKEDNPNIKIVMITNQGIKPVQLEIDEDSKILYEV
ncbi:hypothetical protein [Clostridium paraputrificum]|uniref:hypothetical protein n=1 Tax=Clostridium paraputrificum TaxID=29363 RepID=UPI000667F661|nr:hypothetical protein [Clostridium paraputrificum]